MPKQPNEKSKRRSRIHLAAKLRKAGPHEKRLKHVEDESPQCETCQDKTFVPSSGFNEFMACPDCWGEEPL